MGLGPVRAAPRQGRGWGARERWGYPECLPVPWAVLMGLQTCTGTGTNLRRGFLGGIELE